MSDSDTSDSNSVIMSEDSDSILIESLEAQVEDLQLETKILKNQNKTIRSKNKSITRNVRL
jgi:chaperonin cofactor prefoldin